MQDKATATRGASRSTHLQHLQKAASRLQTGCGATAARQRPTKRLCYLLLLFCKQVELIH